jgi:hypothetical protein
MMIGGMKQVIATTKNGATLTPEQLADAGVEPGERAVIEIRPYSEDEWIAETEGKVLSTEEFIEHLRRAPSIGIGLVRREGGSSEVSDASGEDRRRSGASFGFFAAAPRSRGVCDVRGAPADSA